MLIFFRIALNTTRKVNASEKSYVDWLRTTLLRKLVNWSSEKNLRTSVTSLRLVPVDKYNQQYNILKEKYGRKFVEVCVLHFLIYKSYVLISRKYDFTQIKLFYCRFGQRKQILKNLYMKMLQLQLTCW